MNIIIFTLAIIVVYLCVSLILVNTAHCCQESTDTTPASASCFGGWCMTVCLGVFGSSHLDDHDTDTPIPN